MTSLASQAAAVKISGRVALVVVDRQTRAPLLCHAHAACRRFQAADRHTFSVKLVSQIEEQHGGDLTLAVRPSGRLLVLDFDSQPAYAAFLDLYNDVWGRDDRELCIVKSPKGWHVYSLLPHGVVASQAKERLAAALGVAASEFDIRADVRGQYVFAPGSQNAAGVRYELLPGSIWGDFSDSPRQLSDLVKLSPVTVGTTLNLSVDRALDLAVAAAPVVKGCPNVAEQIESWCRKGCNSHLLATKSSSEALAAFWGICHRAGITVEAAVELAHELDHPITRRAREARRTPAQLSADATRTFAWLDGREKAAEPSTARWEAEEQVARLRAGVTGRSRLPEVLSWIVDRINGCGDPRVAFTVRSLAAAFGTDKTRASRWLKELRERGLIVRVEEARYWDGTNQGHALPPEERTSDVYEVVGLRAISRPTVEAEVLAAFGLSCYAGDEVNETAKEVSNGDVRAALRSTQLDGDVRADRPGPGAGFGLGTGRGNRVPRASGVRPR